MTKCDLELHTIYSHQGKPNCPVCGEPIDQLWREHHKK